MPGKRPPREKDFTRRFLTGEHDADDLTPVERLDGKLKTLRQRKLLETAALRSEDSDLETLPVARVRQVFSLYAEVDLQGRPVRCTVRRTLTRLRREAAIVGDLVRVRLLPRRDDESPQEGVIEAVEPRTTLLTRADSFKARESHPIVANATQMLIVVAVDQPAPRWGLVDRMLVAAFAGGLRPVICLNKIDLGEANPQALADARDVLAHYRKLGFTAHETCATRPGSEQLLRDTLRGHITVLAGHSGVGKSSLVRCIRPDLDIRVGEISHVHLKGKHTTTSARLYDLPELDAHLIDTPGVKLFGLWNVTPELLEQLFPDVADGTAPPWRHDSHTRLLASLESPPAPPR